MAGAGAGVGLACSGLAGAGLVTCFGAGLVTGLGVGFGTGLGVAFGTGLGVGLGTGFGAGLAAGFGAAFGLGFRSLASTSRALINFGAGFTVMTLLVESAQLAVRAITNRACSSTLASAGRTTMRGTTGLA